MNIRKWVKEMLKTKTIKSNIIWNELLKAQRKTIKYQHHLEIYTCRLLERLQIT